MALNGIFMQKNDLTFHYQKEIADQHFQVDEKQLKAVSELESIACQLINRPVVLPTQYTRFRKLLNCFSRKEKNTVMTPVQGLYLWGGVGRGKTWLMDLFFHHLETERKLRLHFHRFMLIIHDALTQLAGHQNPLEIVADRFKAQTDLLCFDEFSVSDITDAMLLATVLKALFSRGITLIATSNIPPDQLYYHGLQRARFMHTIDLIKKHCHVIHLDSDIDYRQRALKNAYLYFTPLNQKTEEAMSNLFIKLAKKQKDQVCLLNINHRFLKAIRVTEGLLAIDFFVLCIEPRSSSDYVLLSRLYHTVLLHNVVVMGIGPAAKTDDNTARRFLALIDEFYERKVKLIISAQVPISELYQGEHLTFEYRRCVSRLKEMQSEEYLSQPHLP